MKEHYQQPYRKKMKDFLRRKKFVFEERDGVCCSRFKKLRDEE
jgi:hypothetical protein